MGIFGIPSKKLLCGCGYVFMDTWYPNRPNFTPTPFIHQPPLFHHLSFSGRDHSRGTGIDMYKGQTKMDFNYRPPRLADFKGTRELREIDDNDEFAFSSHGYTKTRI